MKVSDKVFDYKKVGPVGWSAVFFALSFNFGIALNSIGFGLFAGIALLMSFFDMANGEGNKDRNIWLLAPVALFLVISIRELTVDLSNSFSVVYRYSALLLIPIAVYFQSHRLKNQIHIILNAFLVGCLLSSVINFSYAVYRGVLTNPNGINFWYFTYDFLAEPIGVQPIYLALFYLFGILILLELNPFKGRRIWFAISLFLLVMGILLLSARNALATMLLVVPLHQLLRKKLSAKKAIIGFLLLLLTGFIAFQNPVIKNRIMKVNRSGNVYSGTSLRMQIWETAWHVAESEIILGKGEVQVEKELLQEYDKKSMEVPLKYGYHAHNEYLQLLAQYGLLGLGVFIGIILIYGFQMYTSKEVLGFLWLCVFSLAAVTESVLSRQWGVYAFVFFSTILLLRADQKQGQHTSKIA